MNNDMGITMEVEIRVGVWEQAKAQADESICNWLYDNMHVPTNEIVACVHSLLA